MISHNSVYVMTIHASYVMTDYYKHQRVQGLWFINLAFSVIASYQNFKLHLISLHKVRDGL